MLVPFACPLPTGCSGKMQILASVKKPKEPVVLAEGKFTGKGAAPSSAKLKFTRTGTKLVPKGSALRATLEVAVGKGKKGTEFSEKLTLARP